MKRILELLLFYLTLAGWGISSSKNMNTRYMYDIYDTPSHILSLSLDSLAASCTRQNNNNQHISLKQILT